MHMAEWVERLDAFLQFNERNVLTHAGSVSHEPAARHTHAEFEKHEAERRRLEVAQPASDFDRAVEAVQVIEELIGLAGEMRAAQARAALKLSEDELAFYDALETNDSAVKVLGDDALRAIACELVESVRKNVTIDWTIRDNVRAQLRVLVKRILRKHGYPPDKQEQATQTSAGTGGGAFGRMGGSVSGASNEQHAADGAACRR